MVLQFKYDHIAWAVETIWDNPAFSYHLKSALNAVCAGVTDGQQMISIDVPEDMFLMIYGEVTNKPEGVSSGINHEMLTVLGPQLDAVSNISAVMAGTAAPNEAARMQIGVKKIDDANTATKAAKIENGKFYISAAN